LGVFVAISIFTLIAFLYATSFTVDSWINLVFARYQLIFLAHQGFLHLVVGSKELVEERFRWREKHSATLLEQENEKEDSTLHTRDDRVDKRGELIVTKLSPDWLFGYKMLFNAMCLGTKWQARRPVSRTMDQTNLRRSSFVFRCLLKLLGRYIALCIMYDPLFYFRMPNGVPITAMDYSPSNRYFVSMLLSPSSNATNSALAHALAIRSWYLLELFLREFLILSSYHDILAILFVGILRLDSPVEWPPLFGDITKAYTIRGFWASYWHLLIYRSFSGFIGLGMKRMDILGRKGPASRLLHNALVFVASGFMHVMVRWVRSGGTCGKCGCWGIFWWFVLQPVGIAIEAVVIEVARSMLMRHHGVSSWLKGNGRLGMILSRLLGYVWLLVWLNFATEATEFPSLFCSMVS
jgi:hypothetical protein